MKKIYIFITIVLLWNLGNCLELSTQDVSVLRVGVVDMNKVLQEYPKTKKVQDEISLFKENKKAELTVLEKEVEDLMKKKLEILTEIEQLKLQMKQLELTFSTPTVVTTEMTESTSSMVVSTTVVQNVEKSLQLQQIEISIQTKQKNVEEIDKTISEKKESLKQKQKDIETEVEKIKEKAEVEIYSELYNIIQKISQREGLNIVIDKSGILYGQPEIDITEKVLKMIK